MPRAKFLLRRLSKVSLFILVGVCTALSGCGGGGTNTPPSNIGAGVPASVTATGGNGQSSVINTPFPSPLQGMVKDDFGNGVANVSVTFAAPSSGASGTFAGGSTTTSAMTNSSGVATAPTFTPNGVAGSYSVMASVSGVLSTANFNLTNNAGAAASVTVAAGGGQSTPISLTFTTLLQATVKDAGGNLVANATVTFTAPSNGASGIFANGTATTTAATNSSGVATASAFTANSTQGPFNVTGSVPGVGTNAVFGLANNAPLAVEVTKLSSSTPSPFDIITITGIGFDSTAMVDFSSSTAGYSVSIQPAVLSQTSMLVVVPVLFSGGNFSTGAVSMSVTQDTGTSNTSSLTIGAIPSAPSLPPGTVTLAFLESELAMANQLKAETTQSPLPSDLTALINSLNNEIAPIQAVVSGTSSTANLGGNFNGQQIILTTAQLTQMDQLFMSFLHAVNDSTNSFSLFGGSLPPPTSTGCIAAPTIPNFTANFITNGGGTASEIAADLVYLNQGIGTSSATAPSVIKTLEFAPTAILQLSPSNAVAVPNSFIAAAEIFESFSDGMKLTNYLASPASGGDDETQYLQPLIGRVAAGPTGDVLSFALAGDQIIKDLPGIPLAAPVPQASACVAALSMSFQTQQVQTASASQSITLTNTSGTVPLNLTLPMVVGGPNPAVFADFKESDNCPGTLNPSATCTISVNFTPSTAALENATITISGTAPALPITIAVSGTGTQSASQAPAATPSLQNIGTTGGCSGGALAGTINVVAPPGVMWQIPAVSDASPAGTMSFSPQSGTGSTVVSVTDTQPPQTPYPGTPCSNTELIPYYIGVNIIFSSGPTVQVLVVYTFIYLPGSTY